MPVSAQGQGPVIFSARAGSAKRRGGVAKTFGAVSKSVEEWQWTARPTDRPGYHGLAEDIPARGRFVIDLERNRPLPLDKLFRA